MKKKLTVFLACTALLTAGSGTMWGQNYVKQSTVNNDFGAGESSFITVGNHGGQDVTAPWSVVPMLWKQGSTTKLSFGGGYTNSLEATTPVDIILGGGTPNTVIKTYTGNGFAMGWISVLDKVPDATGNPSSATAYPNSNYSSNTIVDSYLKPTEFNKTDGEPIFEFSFNKFNFDKYDYNDPSATPPRTNASTNWGTKAPCNSPLFQAYQVPGTGGCATVYVTTHIKNPSEILPTVNSDLWVSTTACPSDLPYGIYTSTINGSYSKKWDKGYFTETADTTIVYPIDDGVALVQFSGSNMTNGLSLKNQPTYKLKSDVSQPLGDIAVSALTTPADWADTAKTKVLEYITNYRRPTTVIIRGGAASASPVANHLFNKLEFNNIAWNYEVDSVIATPTFKGDLSKCNSGNSSAFEFGVAWNADMQPGATLIDGAIALQPNAWVCVEGDVADKTSKAETDHTDAEKPDAKTDAILVLPNSVAGRFTLRVAGSIDSVNMFQDTTSLGKFYTQETFPQHEQNIYLYEDSLTPHPFAKPLLTSYPNAAGQAFITNNTVKAPTSKATASILGVYKNYMHTVGEAEIHTDTVASSYDGNNPGVIEVGPQGIGRDHLHVYSGGILKNFESCTAINNFTMNFGAGFGTPDLKMNQDSTLYIMNYGNDNGSSCLADIVFHYAATDTFQTAINGATGKGAMRVQALSDVEFHTDEALTPAQQNNLLVLSDGGNVVTQKFDFTANYADPIAKGLLMLWAEDGTPNGSDFSGCAQNARNATRGNIYLNNDATITRSTGGPVETDFIAANNIRTSTVTYTSDNTDNDTTNVISRKGDLYLGYGIKAPVFDTNDASVPNGNGKLNYDANTFDYTISDPANAGVLNIKAGFDDANFDNVRGMNGGNVYFTSIKTDMIATGEYPTNIMIPYSNEYICGVADSLHSRNGQMQHYEHSGIIGGVGRCGVDGAWGEYAGALSTPASNAAATNLALDYKGNKGTLTVDAGQRGNIIMNTGSKLDFQADNGNAIFRTREGDIDMRSKTDATGMAGNLMFLASIDNLSALKNIFICGCDEERNNVYLQDFQFTATGGSVLFGADNNIKLNYGGLQNQGTHMDPFLSTNYNAADPSEKIGSGYNGTTCGSNYHCDMTPSENLARDLLADFSSADSGGFAAVASDRIDVYKKLIYNGGTGTGIMSVPTSDGRLHGENVTGYGLYMLTQGNKSNYNHNIFLSHPTCPTGDCGQNNCSDAFLHNTIRMTFHDEARFYAENQKVYIASPVIESFGHLELNTRDNAGSNGFITMKMDSLICHDSLIFNGNKYKFTTWSGLPGDKPIIKLGYNRNKPPFTEYKYKDEICAPCHKHIKGSKDYPLDTISVKFGDDATLERQNVTVLDHTILTFLTDSFDHQLQSGVRNAKIYVDTLKVRNQVELWADGAHTRDAHFELISEEQMFSKDYAGMYTRHLHMEPIGPDCARNTSELWLSDDRALDVITTSTFGGFGVINADVHVENEGFLAPGFASLGLRGNCYEQHAGTLTMDDLRLDGGAIINVTVGDATPGPDGYLDMVNVLGNITTYGNVYIHIKLRPCQHLPNMCGAINPVLKYNTATPGSLNNVFLVVDMPKKDSKEYTDYKDDWDALAKMTLNMTSEGEIYICESSEAMVEKSREINMPSVAGVTTNPPAGIHYVKTGGNFNFTASYTTDKPYVVKTNRYFDGVQEVLEGKKNANGEYEYTIGHVTTEPIEIYIGPEFVANASIEGNAVWSHNNTIYIKVDRADIASIYSVAGQLVKRVELSEGDTSIPAERGVYIITLKDGSVHKVIVK